MARVQCMICEKKVDTNKGNYVFANGMHQHKKCPSLGKKLSKEEVEEKRALTDAIKKITEEQGIFLSPMQWKMIASQIKKLYEEGYSYVDQLKAFRWYFDPVKNNEYQGYGIIGYVIEQALHEMKEEKEMNTNMGDMNAMKKKMEEMRKARQGRQ